MVAGQKTPALLYGCLPGPGNAAAQGASGFSVQERGNGGIRDLRTNYRLTYPHHVPALSSGSGGRPILRMGIQHRGIARRIIRLTLDTPDADAFALPSRPDRQHCMM